MGEDAEDQLWREGEEGVLWPWRHSDDMLVNHSDEFLDG